jgi:hypothetical protein
MSLLFITAGTKGGIGKTMTATMLADTALLNNMQVVLYDCDNENESLKNSYLTPAENCRIETVRMMSDEVDMDYPLDFVVNDIIRTESGSKNQSKNVYIVDMKAGTTHYTLEWLEEFPFDDIRAQGIKIYIVGCITADFDSVYTLSRWIARFTEDMLERKLHFLIVKNPFQGNNFDCYEEVLADSMEGDTGSNLVIELPDFGRRYSKRLKDHHTTFGQVATGKTVIKQFDHMDRYRVKSGFRKVVKAFETVWAPPAAAPEESKQ